MCEFEADAQGILNDHMQTQHRDNVGPAVWFECNLCNYEADTESRLKSHVQSEHKENERNNRANEEQPSNNAEGDREPQKKRFCIHWNKGYCPYENKCRFAHEESPECYFKSRCNRKHVCSFFHADMLMNNEPFLDQGQNAWSHS